MGKWDVRFSACALVFALGFSNLSFAEEKDPNTTQNKPGNSGTTLGPPASRRTQPNLLAVLAQDLRQGSRQEQQMASLLVEVISDYLSETVPVVGPLPLRDAEADAILDQVVQSMITPGGLPVLLGEGGSGKTSAILRAVQKGYFQNFPASPAHQSTLDNAIWIQTQPALLSALAEHDLRAYHYKALRNFAQAVSHYEQKLGRKIIVVMDDLHTLGRDQAGAFSTLMATGRAPSIVGTATAAGLQLRFKDFPDLQKRVVPIALKEFNADEIAQVLQTQFLPKIQNDYSVTIDPKILALIIKNAKRVFPDRSALSATQSLIREIALKESRLHYPSLHKNPNSATQLLHVTQDDALEFLSEKAGYPIHPLDVQGRQEFAQKLNSKIEAKVLGQERMVKEVTALGLSILDDSSTGMGVAVLIGPSGTGKSELGRSIAQYLFGNPQAFLNIDANEYKSGGHSLMKLFGAENGILTSDTKSGILPEFFDDPARGKYRGVILIDEGERAHPEFWERLMEFFDRGSFVGGDGKRRYANQHLVLITSNRGEKILFPEGCEKWPESEMQARLGKLTQTQLKDLFLRKTSGRDTLEIPAPVLNRVNLFTVSRPLTRDAMKNIVQGMITEFIQHQKEQLHVQWVFDDSTLDALVPVAPSRTAGARPIIHRTREVLRRLRDQVISTTPPQAGDSIHVTSERTKEAAYLVSGTTQIELEAPPVTDPLRDPRIRNLIREFPAILRGHLVGQNEAVEGVIHALRSHMGTPESKRRPMAFFAVGPTGTGKTELGRGIAHALYGNADRAQILSMGEITSPEKLTRFFGSDPGYIGSQDERAFEKALQATPQGGVLIFDEASNVGGGNPGLKEALFKTLYPLVEEGKWTSSATGVEYDLRNHVFLFTGNDGDQLFAATSADDLRLATWERNKSKSRVREILAQGGVPLPFLGRMADLFLFKPLMRDEVASIVESQLKPVLQEFESSGLHLVTAPGFAETMAQTFFGSQTGARSLRSLIQERLRGSITELLVSVDEEASRHGTLTLSTRVIAPRKPYMKDPIKEAPRAYLSVSLSDEQGNVLQTVEYDATGEASFAKRRPYMEAIKTAYHEAGHAVMNDSTLSGKKLRHLTILGDERSLGYAHSDLLPGAEFVSPVRETVIHEIAMLMGGQVATLLSGHPPDAGWQMDLEMARGLASRYLKKWGFGAGLTGADLDEQRRVILSPSQQDALGREINAMLYEAMEMAQTRLSERWGLVFLTMRELIRHGSITGERLEELEKRYESSGRWNQLRPRANAKNKTCAELLMPGHLKLGQP